MKHAQHSQDFFVSAGLKKSKTQSEKIGGYRICLLTQAFCFRLLVRSHKAKLLMGHLTLRSTEHEVLQEERVIDIYKEQKKYNSKIQPCSCKVESREQRVESNAAENH